jgi:hypothetical protein
MREWSKKNRDKCNAYRARWEKKNPEWRTARRARWKKTSSGKAANRRDRKNRIERLKPCYLADLLGIKTAHLTEQLATAKQSQVLLTRKIKELRK